MAKIPAAAFLLAALLFGAPWTPAAGASTDSPCPYPLGEPAVSGENAVLGGGDDPEFQIIDATRVEGGNQVQGSFFTAGGRMGVVQEMKVEFGSSTNDTDMIMLRWFEGEKGWNGTPVWLSSADPSTQVPDSPPGYIAFHSRVSATAWRDQVWTIWEGWHSVYAPENQAILLRGATPQWVSPIFVASNVSGEYDSAKYGALAPLDDRLMVVYVTRENGVSIDEYDVVWRLFDGQNFTEVLPLSAFGDGWSEFIPSILSDGERVYAVWEAQALHSYVYELRWSVFDGARWSEPATLVETSVVGPSDFSAALLDGRLWVAYDTNEPYTVNGGDLEIALVSLDPATGARSAPRVVNPQPSDGDDTKPALYAAGGRLYVGWQTADPAYSHHLPVNDTDAVYRSFDGTAFGPVVELSDADDAEVDGAPSFLEAERSVYAYWLIGKFPPPPGYKHDYRQAVKLVEREGDRFALINSSVAVEPPAPNGTVRVWATVTDRGDSLEAAPALRTADGEFVPLEPAGDKWTALLNESDLEGGTPSIAVCGKPVETARDDALLPSRPGATPAEATGPGLVVAGVLAAALAVTVLLQRRARR